MDFQLPGRVSLARLPTPVQPLLRLSSQIGGPNFFVKRDDLTGSELGGNKVRKLEFALAEAIAAGADTVITCGSVQSNHCRATAVAAVRLGLKPVLFLRGERPEVPQGNLMLDEWVGADVRFITAVRYRTVADLMQRASDEVAAAGGSSYVIPEGASNAIGSFGYAAAAAEIAEDCRRKRIRFDYIVHACGSGGTAAGLIAGRELCGLDVRIMSFSVAADAAFFTGRVRSILVEMAERYGCPFDPAALPIRIIDGYKGLGYALNEPREFDFMRRIARLEGLILDPVYTGKAFLGMVEEARRGLFEKGSNVLFIHTGGIFGLLAKAAEISGRQNG